MIKFPSRPFRFPEFPRVEHSLNLFRIAVEAFVRDVNRCPLVTGNHVEDIEFEDGVTIRVNHKLGRMPKGWLVTTLEDKFILLESSRTDRYIEFTPYSPSGSHNTYASIWFF